MINYLRHIVIIIYALLTAFMIIVEHVRDKRMFGMIYIITIGYIIIYTLILMLER